jgi:hypothetical protein
MVEALRDSAHRVITVKIADPSSTCHFIRCSHDLLNVLVRIANKVGI